MGARTVASPLLGFYVETSMNPRPQVQVEVGVPRSLENVFIVKC